MSQSAPSSTASSNSKNRLIGMSILALIGAVVSVYLTSHFYSIRTGSAGFKSACNFGSAMNCDVIAASPYAELVAGIPLSSFATGWFLAIALIASTSLLAEWRKNGIRALLAMTAFATLMSALYLIIMAMVLKTFCLFCLVVDAINPTLLILARSLYKSEGIDKERWDIGGLKGPAIAAAVCLFVAIVGLKGMEEASVSPKIIQEIVASVNANPPVSVNAGPEFPSLGAKDARVTIVEFSDFQCPYCRLGAFTLHTVLSRYPNDVRVVHRNYPLDAACNSKMKNPGHAAACESARGAVCANKMGKFKEYFEQMFENQKDIKAGYPAEVAKRIGLDAAQFETCLKAPETADAVAKDLQEGDQLGVQSTPTFFMNGKKVDGVYPLPVWTEVINGLLK